ncbi:MAG: hypothetical protein CM1200mP29_10580 [Verrucomicrobiota bacterium]|nr:MAG: hypothetical protein CM1200mP29_10580 [Verrucomicrobiota bacterium]
MKIVDLYVEENQLSNAVQRLQRLFIRHPGDPATGLSHLTLGELRLRQFYELPDASRLNFTNPLSEALGHFDVILRATRCGFEGNRGWAWLGALGVGETCPERGFSADLAQQAYSNAVTGLPKSREQPIAQLK